MSTNQDTLLPTGDLDRLIETRRTIKPIEFGEGKPDREVIRHCIDVARKAPNHHRTEPALFYLLDRSQIESLAQINSERVAGQSPTEQKRQKADSKLQEWANTPGLLVVTCKTDLSSDLVRSKPEVVEEDYAATCCMTQNLLLLLHNQRIATKWSTAPVWNHPRFNEVVGLRHGAPDERVVALVFFGFSQTPLATRKFRPLEDVLVEKTLT